MATLPDKPTASGRTVQDSVIEKLFRPGSAGVTYHLFRREHRDILEPFLKGVLPTVEPDNIRDDDSRQWHFRLRTPSGRDLLAKGRPLSAKGWIPQSAIDALEAQLKTFAENCSKGKPMARELVKHFWLPDPDKQPELYRLVGEKWKPQLTVLWGFRFPKDSGSAVPVHEAITSLRKRQCNPIYPVLQHLVQTPLLILGIAVGAWWGIPKTYEEYKLAMAAGEQNKIKEELAGVHLPVMTGLADRSQQQLEAARKLGQDVSKDLADAKERSRNNELLEYLTPKAKDHEHVRGKALKNGDELQKSLDDVTSRLAPLEASLLTSANKSTLAEIGEKARAASTDIAAAAVELDKTRVDIEMLAKIADSTVKLETLISTLNSDFASAKVADKDLADALKSLASDDPGATEEGSEAMVNVLASKMPKLKEIVTKLGSLKTGSAGAAPLLATLRNGLAAQYQLIVGKQRQHQQALRKEDASSSRIMDKGLIANRLKEIDQQIDEWTDLWSKAGLLPSSGTGPQPSASTSLPARP